MRCCRFILLSMIGVATECLSSNKSQAPGEQCWSWEDLLSGNLRQRTIPSADHWCRMYMPVFVCTALEMKTLIITKYRNGLISPWYLERVAGHRILWR